MNRICMASAVFFVGVWGASATAQNTPTTPTLSLEQAVAIALAQQPGTVAEAEQDVFEGRAVADIEIVNEAGDEIEFKVDLETGEILDVWTDDDPTDDPAAATLDDVTFLIPGDIGGGWDTVARNLGNAFTNSGVAEDLVLENRAGENGGVGLEYMIENADALANTLMLNTTQSVTRSLNGIYSHSFEDLVPVAAPIADFAAFIVHPNSDIQSMGDLVAAYRNDASSFAIGGGSARNGIDHVIAALVIEAADEDPAFDYVQFDAPEPALAALVAGQVTSLTTEYTRAHALAEQGIVRILGVTAPENYPLPANIPNLHQQDIDMEFVMWTGFFAPPNTSEEVVDRYDAAFAALYETAAWNDAVAGNGWLEVRADADLFSEHLDEQYEQINEILEELTAQ